MIKFSRISVKNFLSYGNVASSIQLDQFKNTLIVGTNGSGKSSIITDAICFALYGKPYRSIKLGQLINSVNQKGMEVIIDFSIGSTSYKIKRGMKPQVFEIYKDGKLIDQEAATKDYQGHLENHILKINYKTFCQVVILGTASFVPFMQLNAAQRRDVIEDVLDIAIFSNMNTLLKSRISENKDEMQLINVKIDSAKKETAAQQKVIKVLEEARDSRISEENEEIGKLESEIKILEKEKKKVSDKIVEISKTKPSKVDPEELQSADRIVSRLEDELVRIRKRTKTVSSLDECPTCLQSVGESHKADICSHNEDLIESISKELSIAKATSDELSKRNEEEKRIKDIIIDYTNKLNDFSNSIHRLEMDIKKRKTIIENFVDNSNDINTEKSKLKSIADNALKLISRKTELMEEKSIQDVISLLLKDSGIKAAIIKEYVPILNRIINKYLGAFGFFINFTLDENFNEKILSRGRDEFSYSSFSEGEKAKIDLALMFAFREITEMKNSANCNLLVLDELGESSLDLPARENFLEILTGLEGGNNFVISHSAPSHESYDSVIKVTKKNDFSVMEFI